MAETRNGTQNNQATPSQGQGKTDVYEDEINLGDYIQVIIKRRKLVILIFLIAVAATAVYSLFLPKVYQASASIMVMPSMIRAALSPTRDFLDPETTDKGGYIEQKPAISLPTHIILLKSNAVLQKVIEGLKSSGGLSEELTLEGLSKKLKVMNTKETNILQLVAKDNDTVVARNIVNIWAKEYIKYSLEIIMGEAKGSGEFVEGQFKLVKNDLINAEQAVKDFNVKERLGLMEIELKENLSQLVAHYAKVHKLGFVLKEKRSLLQKTGGDIAGLSKDGVWLGAFSVRERGEKHFADETLSSKQKALRQKALKAKLVLEDSTQKRDSFVNDSRIMLLRGEVGSRRTNILSDKGRLAQIRQISESIKANLEAKSGLDLLKDIQSPISENLSELTVWEILSLVKGYNFFETRGQSLASKLEQQEKELRILERALLGHNDTLKTLDENLNRAQADYSFYHNQFKALQSNRNSLEMEIAKVEFEVSYSREMVEKLEEQVKTLKVVINAKKTELTDLNRRLDISKKAYSALALKIEDARIAKAMELGEVKVVSTAFEPQSPVAPNKRRMVAIAGIVSLIFGVFMAFCLELWQKSEDIKKSMSSAL